MASVPQVTATLGSAQHFTPLSRLFKVDYGHEEVNVKWGGDPRRYNTLSKRFLDDGNGRVSGVETVLVEWTKVGKATSRPDHCTMVQMCLFRTSPAGGTWPRCRTARRPTRVRS